MSRVSTAALVALLPLAALAESPLPLTITHSGYLLDSADKPRDGEYSFAFRIFDRKEPLDTGETLVWESGDCRIPVSGGFYATVLGESCSGPAPLTAGVFPPSEPRYLEVSIDGQVLLPRLVFGAVPVAGSALRSLDTQALIAVLTGEGTINDEANPVHWSRLKGVPPSLVDGVLPFELVQDGTLLGAGTADSPLGVVFGNTAGTAVEGDDPRLSDAREPLPGSPWYLDAVTRDSSLQGAGTENSPLGIAFGDTAGTAVEGNDPRLSDARQPLPGSPHYLGAVTGNDSLLGAGTPESPLGVVFGDTAGTAAQGNDPRLSDARDPLPGSPHYLGAVTGNDSLLGAGTPESPLGVVFGDIAGTAVEGNDPRLSDAREPLPGSPHYLGSVSRSAALTGDGTAGAPLGIAFGTTAGKAVEGNDPRLSDAREPLPGSPHYLGSVSRSASLTGDGTAGAPLGVVFGDTAGKAVEGNDPRLSDAREPLPGSPHYLGSVSRSASLTGDGTAGAPLGIAFGNTAGKAVEGNDPRLSDSRPPRPGSAHYVQVEADGSSVILNNLDVGGAVESLGAVTARSQIRSTAPSGGVYENANRIIDWDRGNVQTTSASCGSVTFQNMKEGGSYTLIVLGTAGGTCTFSQSNAPDSVPAASFRFQPPNHQTTPGRRTVYTFLRAGGQVYVSWIPGF